MWNIEGMRVKGLYIGSIPVEGIVIESRIKYGGAVSHHVDLFFPITVFGSERTRVVLDANELVSIENESSQECEFDV
jgi:hypothetical protein